MRTSLRKNVRLALWVIAIVLGAAQAWTSRFDLVNDTVSYLDMGDNFFQGHPIAILNGIWSPLYAVLLGLTLKLSKPTIYSEYPTVHLLLFFIYVLTLVCFDFFLRELLKFRDGQSGETQSKQSDLAWLVIAYVFFFWTSLQLIGVYETNPDMLIAGLFYLACALLVKIASGAGGWKSALLLGVVLGTGYLTKAAMLPISLAMLFLVVMIARKSPRRILAAMGGFVLVASPFVIAFSMQQGHFTFGESSKYNYAVHVDNIPRHHWQGNEPGEGTPAHPTREIFAAPATFEFGTPIVGTYPIWYDPMYWYAGVKPHFHVRNELRAIATNEKAEFDTFYYALDSVLLTSFVLACFALKDKRRALRNYQRLWFLLLLPAAACALYVLVHYETRYVGGFFCVLGIALFSGVMWADDGGNRRLYSGIAVLQFALILWWALPVLHHVGRAVTTDKGSYEDVAQGATNMGLHAGDSIASLNFSNLGTAMWARLAHVRIVAEVYYWPGGFEGGQTSFWSLDAAGQERLLQRLAATGAKAVVSSDAPTGADAARWSRIGETGYYLLWLTPPTH